MIPRAVRVCRVYDTGELESSLILPETNCAAETLCTSILASLIRKLLADRGDTMSDHQRPHSRTSAELLVDESPDALIALSLDGRIQSWNRGARAMFGYDEEEAIGRAIDE